MDLHALADGGRPVVLALLLATMTCAALISIGVCAAGAARLRGPGDRTARGRSIS